MQKKKTPRNGRLELFCSCLPLDLGCLYFDDAETKWVSVIFCNFCKKITLSGSAMKSKENVSGMNEIKAMHQYFFIFRKNVCSRLIEYEGYVLKKSAYVVYENYQTCCGLFCWSKCQKSRCNELRLMFLLLLF